MKKAIWGILFLTNICIGQNLLEKLAVFEESARVFNDMNYSVDGIDGHQYFLDNWGTGKIIINDTVNAPQARIQFDMVSGEPIIGNSTKENKGFILRDKSVSGFVINNNKFIRIKSNKFLEEVDRNYFAVAAPLLSENNYLIISYSKILKEPYVLNNGYNNIDQNKKYVSLKKFYVLNKENKYIEIKLKEKSILNALAEKKKELKKHIRSKKLNVKKESDAVKLITYYHSL